MEDKNLLSMVLKQNVGIDMSMDKFDVNLSELTSDMNKKCLGTKKFSNNADGFTLLLNWVDKHKHASVPLSFTIEFTGVYYEQLAYFLKENKQVVCMVIPSKAKKYIDSLNRASKTDKMDAEALSWLGLERNLDEWNPLSPLFLELRTLTREREELLKEQTAIKNRLHAVSRKAIEHKKTIRRYKQRLKLIENQEAAILKEINELLKSDEKLYERYKKLITIPGVALKTAATVIAETNGFAAIKSIKQLTSYAGLDVKLKESGKYAGKSKISKQGNAHIRRVLHFPAQTAIRYNEPLRTFFKRVDQNKSKPMIASVGVQRKLLALMYTIWKNDTIYDPEYEAKKVETAQSYLHAG